MGPSSEDETPERQGRGGLGVNSHGKNNRNGRKINSFNLRQFHGGLFQQ